jgi:PAS domain S-box-containing protein
VLSLGAFALIATWLFGAATLVDRQAALEQGWTDAENTAALLAQHADHLLRIAEITGERVAELVDRQGLPVPGAEPWPALAALASRAAEVEALWLLDGDGAVVASLRGRGEAAFDGAARDFVESVRQQAAAAVSAMFYDRRGGGWLFAWGRALRSPEGALRGVVMVAISGAELERVAAGLALGPSAVLRLSRADGATVMRWPLPAAGAPQAAQEPLPGQAGGRAETGPDGVMRLMAWRAAPGMPVIASAGVARDQVLAPFRARLLRNGALFALSAALAGGLAVAALGTARRERGARRSAEERGAALAAALAEREELLTSVQEGQARLRLAEQAGGIGLWDWDLQDGRLTLVGDVFSGWGLRTRRRISARAALRGVLAEDRPALAAALAAAVRGEAPLEAEFRLAQAAPERWIGVRAEMRRGVDGGSRRLLGIALDVTARRRAAQALAAANATLERRVADRTGALADAKARLREGEARFRGIFDATFQFIGLLSPDGTVLEANAAMLRFGGVDAAAVVGRPYWTAPWWPEAAQAEVRAAVAQAAEGRFVRRETVMRGQDGASLAIDFSIKPVRDEDGIVSLLVPEARDISALKAAQALLLEAQKMETLGRLTGGVAHDFNNLLMAVLGNLALARKRLGAQPLPAVTRHLDAATLGAERGALLTQRLLAFARRQDLNPCAVDLVALLGGLRELLCRSAGPMVEVVVQAPAGLPAAMVDPHALELALMNLVVNARDAMPDGGRIAIVVAAGSAAGARAALAEGRYLSIAVADTGHGMDAATLAQAVEPFFSTKGPGQGTGLGLSMVHGLAHQSGGALEIASAPGAGTVATLWLPVSAEPARLAAVERPAEAQRGSGRVLLVDDEALVLESTAALIEDLGYEVIAAASAEAALLLLDGAEPPLVVITDYAMPGMTGAALAARIGALRPGLPVILATGHAGPWPEGEPPLRLAKPFTQSQLAEALAGATARRAAE